MKRFAMGIAVLTALVLTACGGESQAAGNRVAQAAAVCTCVDAFDSDGTLLGNLEPAGCAVRLQPDGALTAVPACHVLEPRLPNVPPGNRPGVPPQNP